MMVLRRLAYTLLGLYRSVTQRSEDRQMAPWRELMNALIAQDLTTEARAAADSFLRLR